jgi:hypothetical protein
MLMPNTANDTTAQADTLLTELLGVQASKATIQGNVQVVKAPSKGLYPYIADVEARLDWADNLGLKTDDGLTPRQALDTWMATLTIQSKPLGKTVSIKVAVKYWQMLNNSANWLADTDNPDADLAKSLEYKKLAASITEELKAATLGQMNCSHSFTKKDGYFFFPTDIKQMSDEEAQQCQPVWMIKAGK